MSYAMRRRLWAQHLQEHSLPVNGSWERILVGSSSPPSDPGAPFFFVTPCMSSSWCPRDTSQPHDDVGNSLASLGILTNRLAGESDRGYIQPSHETTMRRIWPYAVGRRAHHADLARNVTAKFWLLRMELAYRHLYDMDTIHIGRHHIATVDSKFNREDHLASLGTPGVSEFAESSLAPGEAQAPALQLQSLATQYATGIRRHLKRLPGKFCSLVSPSASTSLPDGLHRHMWVGASAKLHQLLNHWQCQSPGKVHGSADPSHTFPDPSCNVRNSNANRNKDCPSRACGVYAANGALIRSMWEFYFGVYLR